MIGEATYLKTAVQLFSHISKLGNPLSLRRKPLISFITAVSCLLLTLPDWCLASTVVATQYTTTLTGGEKLLQDAIWNNKSAKFYIDNYPVAPESAVTARLTWTGGSASIMGLTGTSSYPRINFYNGGRLLKSVVFPYHYINQYSGVFSSSIDTTGLPTGALEIRFISADTKTSYIIPGVVVPENANPTVSNRTISLNEDESQAITLTVSDPDSGDSHTFQIISPVNSAHGSTFIAGDRLTFTPKPDWNGTTTLTYRAIDSKGAASNVATITITVTPVNDPPVAQAKTLTIDEDTSGSVVLSATDIDSPAPTVFQIVTAPNVAHGTATISGSTLTFTPEDNWNGSTSLTYRARDSTGAWSAPVTMSITVNPVNDAPVAQLKSLTTNEDTAGTVTLSATDIDSPAPTVFQIVTAPNVAHGTVTISGSILTFTPEDNWNGSTSLTYRAQDSAGTWSVPATVTLTVVPVNDPPSVANRTLTSQEDTLGTLTLTVTDVDSTTFTFQVVSQPANGSVSINGTVLTFTPADDWFGTTTLTYLAKDNAGASSNSATITITVTPVNDPPVAQSLSLDIDEDTTGVLTLKATDIDSSPNFTFQIVTSPAATAGTAIIQGDKLTFEPAQDWNGNASLTYRARDPEGAWSVPVPVSITVRPVNDQPVKAIKLIIRTKEGLPAVVRGAVAN